MSGISFLILNPVIRKKFWNALPRTQSLLSSSSLEARLARSEILLGHFYITAAASAYRVSDLFQANESRRRAEAAYSRASLLVAAMPEEDGALLAGELAGLRTALNALF